MSAEDDIKRRENLNEVAAMCLQMPGKRLQVLTPSTEMTTESSLRWSCSQPPQRIPFADGKYTRYVLPPRSRKEHFNSQGTKPIHLLFELLILQGYQMLLCKSKISNRLSQRFNVHCRREATRP
jgi:hypothetical protein